VETAEGAAAAADAEAASTGGPPAAAAARRDWPSAAPAGTTRTQASGSHGAARARRCDIRTVSRLHVSRDFGEKGMESQCLDMCDYETS
jgi:hypothetical protein